MQLNTITAALVDLTSTYDHIAGLAAELCGRVKEMYAGERQLWRKITRRLRMSLLFGRAGECEGKGGVE